MRITSSTLFALAAVLAADLSPLSAQNLAPAYAQEARELAVHPQVAEALEIAEQLDAWSLDRLIELTEMTEYNRSGSGHVE